MPPDYHNVIIGGLSSLHIFYTKKGAYTVLAIFAAAMFAAGIVYIAADCAIKYLLANSQVPDTDTIIIDPGHGDPDGGAVGIDGVLEKDINLAISFKLRNFFSAAGYRVIMTREGNSEIYDKGSDTIRKKKVSDLKNRLSIANSHPGVAFLSIHQNIFSSSSSSGAIVFYSPNNDESKRLAEYIQTGIRKMVQPNNKYKVRQVNDDIFLLYNAKSPAVMVECGFLSNPNDCRMLQDEAYQNKLAFAIFSATLKFNAERQSKSNPKKTSV
mgnify:FL=1